MISLAIPVSIAEQAVCGQVDPELWFPKKGGSTVEPKRICGGCPVREDCLTWALDNRVEWGVWGGLSNRERRKVLRQRGDAA